jgi:putative FmdB family regulatory protein
MPIYSFRCINCQYSSEEFYHIHERRPVTCPVCGQDTLKQEIGLVSDWHPNPVFFFNSPERHKKLAEQANINQLNGDA